MNRDAGLIISTPPPIEATAAQTWLKSRTFPLRFLPRRLNVVVGVENHRRSVPHPLATSNHGGGSLALPVNANVTEKTRRLK
jgi:hypothetical protein